MRTIKNFRQSSSFVMATLCSVLLLAVILFAVYFINLISSDKFLVESRSAINAEISRLLLLERYDAPALMPYLNTQKSMQDNGFLYAVFSPDKSLIYSNHAVFTASWEKLKNDMLLEPANVTQHAISSDKNLAEDDLFQKLDSEALEANFLSKTIQLENGNWLVVARDIDEFRTARWVAMTFGWLILVIAILLAVGFFLIGRFVVAKVNSISGIATEIIQTGNLSRRIPHDQEWDDLSKLETVLNKMLDEIENLMLGIKKVTDDIAHDLRTPLTRLRNDLVSVQDAELRKELLKEADQLLSMFNGLLRIAEIETGKKKSEFKRLALNELVEDAEAFYSPLADEKNISINCLIKPFSIIGDRDLLFQMIVNLLDNAIKFTPKGGKISITLIERNQKIELTIEDSGIGIPEEESERVFRRFYRVDKSRNSSGHGLGLSIVKAIVELHDAKLFLASCNPGTRFTIRF